MKRLDNKPPSDHKAKNKVENYISTVLPQCFDTHVKNWKENILWDHLRSSENKEEDIKFIIDNVEGPRLMELGEVDLVYSKKCGDKAERLQKIESCGASINEDEVKEEEDVGTGSDTEVDTEEENKENDTDENDPDIPDPMPKPPKKCRLH